MMQYPLYPQYPSYPQRPQQNPQNKKFLYILIFAILIVAVVIATLLLRPMSGLSVKCGDGSCDEKENCNNCADDCTCKTGEYCSAENKCVKPVCGNNKCEAGESNLNCCNDCKCELKQEKCNPIKHGCELPEIKVSDERVKELVTDYFVSKGKQVASISSIESGMYNNEIVKRCVVKLVGDDRSLGVVVTAAEKVVEMQDF